MQSFHDFPLNMYEEVHAAMLYSFSKSRNTIYNSVRNDSIKMTQKYANLHMAMNKHSTC